MSVGAIHSPGTTSLNGILGKDPLYQAQSPRLLARDRRLVGIHEAGHIVIAEHLKLRGRARIMPNTDVPHPNVKLWIGQFQLHAAAVHRLSTIRRQMVAVAGAVAEECWRTQYGIDRDPTEWSDCLWDCDWMSASDWRLSDHEPGEPTRKLYRACEAVEALLKSDGPLWPRLLLIAHALIRQGEIGRL